MTAAAATSRKANQFYGPYASDGLDTLRWIEAQPWGGDVGSWGTSWPSWTQTALAVAGTSRLKTIVPMVSGSDAWTSSVRHGGALDVVSKKVVHPLPGWEAADAFETPCPGGLVVHLETKMAFRKDIA